MSVASLQSDSADQALRAIRVGGGVTVAFSAVSVGGATIASRVAEADGWRVRFPRRGAQCEAVLVNTGGGVAGGDTVALSMVLAEKTRVVVTSSAAERVYRSLGGAASMTVSLDLAGGAYLAWLPQETILYSGASLARRVAVTMADDAVLTLADVMIFGRRAHGETMRSGAYRDHWRIVRAGRLVHAEAVRLDGAIDEAMQRAAVGDGAHVVACLLHVAPDAADRLDAVRRAIDGSTARAAVSAWDGRLVVRVLAERSDHARHVIAVVAAELTGQPMPRVWST